MNDILVPVLTGLLALGAVGWTIWGIWHIARTSPTRQRALSHVLVSIAGTALLGVVLPAALMGALDPFPIWLVYAALTTTNSVVLAWRWHALKPSKGNQQSLVIITSCVLIGVLAMAAVAVT